MKLSSACVRWECIFEQNKSPFLLDLFSEIIPRPVVDFILASTISKGAKGSLFLGAVKMRKSHSLELSTSPDLVECYVRATIALYCCGSSCL